MFPLLRSVCLQMNPHKKPHGFSLPWQNGQLMSHEDIEDEDLCLFPVCVVFSDLLACDSKQGK